MLLLPTYGSRLPHRFFFRFACLCLLLAGASFAARAQVLASPGSSYFSRKNTFGVFGAYSPDSSHILLGYAENRKLVEFGVSYNRRLLMDHGVSWQYSLELLPVALESDPVGVEINTQTEPTVSTTTYDFGAQFVTCAPATVPYSYAGENNVTYSGTLTYRCSGRRWTIGEAMSPIGMQWNFRPRNRIQPFFTGHGGYMYSTQPIPIMQAGSFNFTFDLGAGLELYRTASKSIRVEYRYHHISNHNTAQENPGIDNGLFQVSYAFGR
ncbi:MAG TPA: acyloxyacyl hydrolase [Terracidiphilus sp.]|jgi:opacity protein-like surface antigen